MKKRLVIGILILIVLGIGIVSFFSLKKKEYSIKDFNIPQYISKIDYDQDGIDDQTDIFRGVKNYIAKKPIYKSKYYSNGYPIDEYGVCTDVVAQGLLAAGYDLKELVALDIQNHPNDYRDVGDKNIDFRRVRNLKVYFKNTAISLTVDPTKIADWQAGDIVIWDNHIGIISDKRNKKGIPYVIHHYSKHQKNYEQDVLETYGKIIGHYRVS